MTTAGPNAAGAGASEAISGAVAWTNPGNITADDANYATCNITASSTQYLAGSSFGFAIPASATVDGITITVKGKVASGTLVMLAGPAKAVGSGFGGASHPNFTLTTTESTFTLGGATSLFGLTWTGADVDASTFGVIIQNQGGADTANISINYVTVTITYTLAPTTVTPSTLSLTISLKTPTIVQQLRAKPASLANSISLKTPSVVLAQAVRPSSLALVTARFAPTVPLIFKPKPDTLALALNGQTPVLFKILTLKTSAILEAQYADSQTLESLYAATGTIEAQYADSQTLEAF